MVYNTFRITEHKTINLFPLWEGKKDIMTGDNLKYGKLITDGQYIQRVIEDMQDKIIKQKESGEFYSEDGMKDIILDKLDDLYIEPNDVDYIMSELQF